MPQHGIVADENHQSISRESLAEILDRHFAIAVDGNGYRIYVKPTAT
jgi:hypothetical protein